MPFERKEQFGVFDTGEMAAESLRADAGHDVRHAIHGERLSDDVRIGREALLPERVAQNHHGVGGVLKSRPPRQRARRSS